MPNVLRSILIILWFALTPLTGFAAEADAQLFAPLAQVRTLSSKFIQTKKLRGIKKELRLTGSFYLDAVNHRFAWRVESPVVCHCIMSEDIISQWDAESNKLVRIDIKKHPALSGMTDFLQLFFGGRPDGAERFFTLERPEAKTLVLTPKPGVRIASVIEKVTLTISPCGRFVQKIVLLEKNGDRTKIEFVDTHVDTPQDSAVWNAVGQP